MDRSTKIMSDLIKRFSRYRADKFTGQITVRFNFSQGSIGSAEFEKKYKMKPA